MAYRSLVKDPPPQERLAPQKRVIETEEAPELENRMLAAPLDEQYLDWVENQGRSVSDRWRTDLYIAGVCLLIVLTSVAGYLAVTNRLPF
jgi:hypothetical protein